MKNLTEIANDFRQNHPLPEDPNETELEKVYLIAVKQYLQKEINEEALSAITESLYTDLLQREHNHQKSLLMTRIGSLIADTTELGFYSGSLSIYKNPQTPEHKIAYDHALACVLEIKEMLNRFVLENSSK